MDRSIIDIHAHVFPEKIAKKASSSTGDYYGIEMYGDGTVQDLLEKGEKIGTKRYVIHSTATRADQVVSVNNFIASVKEADSRFIGFGTVHPDLEDIPGEIERLISLGFKGIKLHPDFQRFNIDGENMIPIYRIIGDRLPILMHMGDENKTYSTPRRLARVLDIFPDLTIIAAHMGGYMRWGESGDFLVGRDVYFDTSSTMEFLDKQKMVDMIRTHGADKILFGVDYPMWTHEGELENILSLGLSEEELRLILYENACKLLNIDV
ncbi:MAG: amidohydrolase [Clostridiales bacterium]|nr:amidohydrolase [Clostridiales bacterium]